LQEQIVLAYLGNIGICASKLELLAKNRTFFGKIGVELQGLMVAYFQAGIRVQKSDTWTIT